MAKKYDQNDFKGIVLGTNALNKGYTKAQLKKLVKQGELVEKSVRYHNVEFDKAYSANGSLDKTEYVEVMDQDLSGSSTPPDKKFLKELGKKKLRDFHARHTDVTVIIN